MSRIVEEHQYGPHYFEEHFKEILRLAVQNVKKQQISEQRETGGEIELRSRNVPKATETTKSIKDRLADRKMKPESPLEYFEIFLNYFSFPKTLEFLLLLITLIFLLKIKSPSS